MSNPMEFPLELTPSSLAPGLYTARLANGLRVIIRQDPRSPVAICNLWVRVGSNREPEKLRGWSHGIEHMLFKGTERRAEGDFAREVAEAGGTTNAGTGYETTNYHITVPAAKLDTAIDILSDVLFHSRFESGALDAERKVLVHENHMYDDVPFGFGVTWRWGMELACDTSPYRHPIGGKDENLLERDREDILAFWRSAYRPDNMTAVIVGDVDPASAFAGISARFGQATNPTEPIAEQVSIVPSPPVEGSHDGCRLRVEYGDIQKAYAKLIFRGPGEADPDRAALGVVRRVLSDGRSSRLYRHVMEDLQLVDEYAVFTESGPREGIVILDLETEPGKIAPAIEAITRVLGEMSVEGCTEAELERARVRALRTHAFGGETVQGQAGTLGYHDSLGDLGRAFDLPERIAAVTAADVASCCRRVFRADDLSCVIYLPENTDAKQQNVPAQPEELATLIRPALDSPPGDLPPRVASNAAARTPSRSSSQPVAARFEEYHLAQGIPAWIRVDRTVPVLALGLTSRGGAMGEPASRSGLASLMQMVQVKAAGGMDSETLHGKLESEGASLGPRTDRDSNGLFLSCLANRWQRALEWTGEVICRPEFAPEDLDRERRLALQELASHQDNPFQAATLRLRSMIYGDHPCGRPVIGTVESLPSFARDDLIDRHDQAWRPGNLQIVASGDCDPDQLLRQLESTLEGLPEGPADPAAEPFLIPRPDGILAERMTRQQNQSIVLAAWPGPETPDQDRVPYLMLKELLNGQSGRLFEELRNRRSLCYNTGVLHTAGFAQGMFLGYVMTSPDTEQAALEELVRTLRGMAESPAGTEEFERARAKLLGNLVISNQSNSARAARSDRGLLLGRGANDLEMLLDAVAECTADQVTALADRIFDAEHRFQVVLGPSEG